MSVVDFIVFYHLHDATTIKELHDKVKKNINISKKTLYTIVDRLVEEGLVAKRRVGRQIIIQQINQPVSIYLHNLIKTHPYLVKKHLLTQTSIDILLTLLHRELPINWIADVTGLSQRNTRRYLVRLYKSALIKRHTGNHKPLWSINKVNSELTQFLEAYEEFRALRIIDTNNIEASLIWVQGIEFLIRTPMKIDKLGFKETGAMLLEKYGLKLISAERTYFYTNRELTLWDHAFLTFLSRRNDPTQLRYLAYLYKIHQSEEEFNEKGRYYDPETTEVIQNLFQHGRETATLRMSDIEELEKLYGE